MAIISGVPDSPLPHLSQSWKTVRHPERYDNGRKSPLAPLVVAGSIVGVATMFLVTEGTVCHPFVPLLSLAACFLITRFFGCSQGTLSSLILLAFLYASGYFGNFDTPARTARFSEVAVMTFGATLCACWLRNGEYRFTQLQRERSSLSDALSALERRQREFVRDVIATVTDQRLFVCESAADLQSPLASLPCEDPLPLSSSVLFHVRSRIRKAAATAGLSDSVAEELVIAGSEAALNAVVHGENGVAEVYADCSSGKVQIWVRDEGTGIGDDLLHRATLERGFSSAGTLGQGFPLIVSTCHRVFLLTGKTGTTIVLEGIRQ